MMAITKNKKNINAIDIERGMWGRYVCACVNVRAYVCILLFVWCRSVLLWIKPLHSDAAQRPLLCVSQEEVSTRFIPFRWWFVYALIAHTFEWRRARTRRKKLRSHVRVAHRRHHFRVIQYLFNCGSCTKKGRIIQYLFNEEIKLLMVYNII